MASRAQRNLHRQFVAVARKELLQTARDRRIMAMLLVAPLIQLIIFGYAIDFDVDRVPTVVVAQDQGSAGREHERRLLADGTLRLVGRTRSSAEAERKIEQGRAAATVILPEDLSRQLDRGRTAEVQVILDGTDPNRANVAAAAVGRYFAEVANDSLQARLEQSSPALAQALPRLTLTPRIFYNPRLKSPPFMIPAVMTLLLVVVTTITTAMGLAREREMGTLEQVLVTPIEPVVFLLGKMVPFILAGLFDVLLALTAGAWLFDLPLRGPLPVLAAGTLLYILTLLGVGLLISTVSRTQQQSFLGGFLFVLPAVLLSGAMTPIRGMPQWLQLVTYLNPVRYYAEILRANLLKGAGFGDLWLQLLVLAAFSVGIVTLAGLRFHKRLG